VHDIIHSLTAVAGSTPETSAVLLQQAAEVAFGPPAGFLRLYREQLGLELEPPPQVHGPAGAGSIGAHPSACLARHSARAHRAAWRP
jgi:hypothetical protein